MKWPLSLSLNILDSQLILNPPSSLEDLLSCYNSTLSNLLNIHAPLITKQYSHANNLWFSSYIQAFKTFRRHLEHVYKHTIDPASRAEALTNGSFRVKSTNFLQISSSTISDFEKIFTECALMGTGKMQICRLGWVICRFENADWSCRFGCYSG